MRRERRLDVVLAALTTAAPHRHPAFNRALHDGDDLAADRAFVTSVRALACLWLGEFERGATLAEEALDAADPDDVDALALARAVAGWAIGWRVPAGATFGDPIADALADTRPVSPPLRSIVDVLLTEAAIACIRIDLAAVAAQRIEIPEQLFGRPGHPFLTFIRLTPARVRLLAGDIATAQTMIAATVAAAPATLMLTFAQAHAAMAMSNADQRVATRRALRDIDASGVVPAHLLADGVYIIAAYAAIAQNDIDAAARLVLRAAIDPELSNLRISDRVICIEILVRAAIDAGDLDAALAWQERTKPLAGHPIADSTVDRIVSRTALASGNAAAALRLAERAIKRATARGRGLEVIEGEILAARALVSLGRAGDATRRLADLVSSTEPRGHGSARRSASRELRGTGRRIPPSRTQGWSGLSAREREVAALIAAGASNAEIGAALFLSPHTVRTHVSRILYAFNTPTRAAIAAMIPDQGSPHPGPTSRNPVHRDPAHQAPTRGRADADGLTPRQHQIAALAATGASNRDIAAELGIGLSTVEKHVTAILRRWNLASRAAIGGALRGSGG